MKHNIWKNTGNIENTTNMTNNMKHKKTLQI